MSVNKKTLLIIVLVLFGIYWLFDHVDPMPFNHESFGLYNHDIHRMLGVAFLVAAGVAWWKWKPKKG